MAEKIKLGALAMALSLGVSASALSVHAGELQVVITGPVDADFLISSTPTPAGQENFGGGSSSFYLTNYPITVSGSPVVTPYLEFYNAAASGGITAGTGLNAGGSNWFDLYGPQIFSGTTTNPVLAPGVFTVTNTAGADFTLTISAVPEPATWAMLILGVAMIGVAARRRREHAVKAA